MPPYSLPCTDSPAGREEVAAWLLLPRDLVGLNGHPLVILEVFSHSSGDSGRGSAAGREEWQKLLGMISSPGAERVFRLPPPIGRAIPVRPQSWAGTWSHGPVDCNNSSPLLGTALNALHVLTYLNLNNLFWGVRSTLQIEKLRHREVENLPKVTWPVSRQVGALT